MRDDSIRGQIKFKGQLVSYLRSGHCRELKLGLKEAKCHEQDYIRLPHLFFELSTKIDFLQCPELRYHICSK